MSIMKISKVSTQLLKVPLKQRTITDSQSRVTHVEFLQVKIDTDDGITGWGMNWNYLPGLKPAQVCLDESYAPLLKGQDPLMRKDLMKGLEHEFDVARKHAVDLEPLAHDPSRSQPLPSQLIEFLGKEISQS